MAVKMLLSPIKMRILVSMSKNKTVSILRTSVSVISKALNFRHLLD